MSDGLRPRFWETVPLDQMTGPEWESLCDGCGRCCLNKLEDIDTGELIFTTVACRLFDGTTCRCKDYQNRKSIVPECVVLSPETLDEIAYWMPETCAYRRLHAGLALPDWHPLVSGQANSVYLAGISMHHQTICETSVPIEDWEDHLLDTPG